MEKNFLETEDTNHYIKKSTEAVGFALGALADILLNYKDLFKLTFKEDFNAKREQGVLEYSDKNEIERRLYLSVRQPNQEKLNPCLIMETILEDNTEVKELLVFNKDNFEESEDKAKIWEENVYFVSKVTECIEDFVFDNFNFKVQLFDVQKAELKKEQIEQEQLLNDYKDFEILED